jgi:hypothetical protein
MKIALIKTKSEKITPIQDMNHPSIAKKTLKQNRELVTVFAARWRSIRNISTAQMTTNLKEDYKNNCNTRKVAPSYTQQMTPKLNQEESEQNYHIFQLKLKKCTYAK